MICITDPIEVFRILEQHGEAGFNASQNHASVFQCDHHFAMLVFCCDGNLKGPRLYLFKHPWHVSEIGKKINEELAAISGDEVFENAKALTLETLSSHFESLSASNYFFDAH